MSEQLRDQIRKLMQASNRDTQSVATYASQFEASCDQLAAMGSPVSESDKLHWFVSGLGPEFASFWTVQMAVSPLPSFAELVPRALSHETFLNSMNTTPPHHSTFAATGRMPLCKSNASRGRGTGRGNSTHGGSRRRGKRPYVRKFEGHTAPSCPRDPHSYDANLAEAFNASCSLNPGNQSNWFEDTGTSAHITPGSLNFDYVELYRSKNRVVVGDENISYTSNGWSCKAGLTMPLLVYGHFENKDRLYQTIEDVYRNFTSIHKAAILLLDSHKSFLSIKAGCLITLFCWCSLKRILLEDGITINVSLVLLLADIELCLLNLIKDCTNQKVDNLLMFPDMALTKRICKAYFEPSPIYCCYQLIISYDLMIEFLDHCLHDLDLCTRDLTIEDRETLKTHIIFLRNYLELLIHCNYLDKLLIAVENVAYRMQRYIFAQEMCDYRMADAGYYRKTDIRSEFRVGVLKVLILQSNDISSRAPIMSDELVVQYVKYVQESFLDLLQNNTIDLTETSKGQLWILHEGISFLMHLLITYPPKHNSEHQKLSNIRLDFQFLAMNVGSVVCSCFDNPMIEELSLGLFDLIQKIDVIKGEIIKTICCMVLRETERESPKKDQLASLTILLKNLKEFMDQNPSLTITWKNHENLVLFIFYLIQNDIRGNNCSGDEKFSRYTFSLDVALINNAELDGVLISAQVDAFNMSCHSLVRRCGKLRWWELYRGTKERIDMHMCVGILKAFALSSTTPLTDELLIAYVECVQASLIELLRYVAFDLVTDQLDILNEGIPFLVRLLISYSDEHHEKLSHIKADFQKLVRGVGSVICSNFNNRVNGDSDTAMQQSTTELSKLVEKMNLIIGETEELLHLVNLNKVGRESPKTGGLNSILENWKELMDCESDLIITWKEQFRMIYKNLVLLNSFNTSCSSDDDESQNLCSSIMEAGHVAEYLLSTFSVGTCPVQCTNIWISEFTKHVELLIGAVMELNEKKRNMKEIDTTRMDRCQVSVQKLLVPTLTDMVVGFEVEMELIRERLTGRIKQLDVIPIIGMPGLGKTTLARKAYEDPYAINHFDVRAWCCFSQEYNKKGLIHTILDSIIVLTDQIREKNEAELSVMVHKQLKGRRYFIVVDDIWEIDAFMGLKTCFPDDNNGSRIMLTSRSKAIGSQAQSLHHGHIIEPRVLTIEQSWDLLQRKIYNKEKCPPELCLIGKEIAEKCKGLPLAVVVVGGVLTKSTQNRDFWEQVLRNLSSYLARDSQSQFMASLELSYEYLPDFLKPMFLYFGAFPEDEEIPAKKLMRLWMAEGFVQKTESSSLESQAEKNLMDLIDRSLVMVAKRSWDGRVKTCHVHDLLRDMCLAKAKEENFMQQVHVHNGLPYPVMYQRRLSILLKRNDKTTTSRHLVAYKDLPKFSITPPIYSLLFFHAGSVYFFSDELEGIEPVVSSLKLLKVFDAEIFIITRDVLDKDLTMLVHLRYVSFTTTSLKSIPSAISRLRRLETLIIRNRHGSCIHVPETIWEMKKLRHLRIKKSGKFRAAPESSFILENLQTLSTFCTDAGEEEKIFRKLPGLKNLRCLYQIYGHETQQIHFPDFESLGKLESLTFRCYTNRQKFTSQFKFPLTLKKLKIQGIKLKWIQISMLKTLPNLEALSLEFKSVEDECWDMEEDDVFTNLKFLKLQRLGIEKWSVSSVNFPSLEKLGLYFCQKLVEISSELGEIDTLQKILVIECNNSLEKLVKAIQKEQEEYGNESLEFYFSGNKDWTIGKICKYTSTFSPFG